MKPWTLEGLQREEAMKPSENLRGALELIATPEKWTKGTEARDASGKPCRALSPAAVCFCVIGATERASTRNDMGVAADRYLHRAIFGLRIGILSFSIDTWQDATDRTHAEVVAVFKAAIALAESEGQ